MSLNYRIEGNLDGPPLLLVHGLGMTFSVWNELAPLLHPYYKLIPIELPGNGQSPALRIDEPYYATSAILLEELRQSLEIPRWNMLGYSIGARVVRAYQERFPERVCRVALLCPAYFKSYVNMILRMLRRIDPKRPWICDWLLDGWRLDRLIRLSCFNGQKVARAYTAIWTQEMRSQPAQVTKQQLRDLLSAVKAPSTWDMERTLILWGLQDRLVQRPKTPARYDRFIPGTHGAPVLFADQIADELLRFLSV